MKIGIAIQWMSRANGGVFEAAKLACRTIIDGGMGDVHVFSASDAHLASDIAALPEVSLHVAREYGSRRFGFAPAMLRQMLASDIDLMIVHGLWTWHSLAAYLWMKRTGRPCIVVPHGMLEPWIMQRSARTKRWFWKGFTRSLVERAMAVQVLTEAERDSLTALTAKARAVIIPNFVPAREGDAILPAWWDESFEGKRLFLFFGRLHEKKGIVELCAAWRQFNLTHPAKAAACKLVFCGWIDGLPDFEQTVAQIAGEFGNIHFAGPQYGEEKWRSMAAADFMLLPSKSEGLPMSILEGWSLGLPAIMTDGCNLPLGFERGAAMRTGTDADAIAASLIDAADMDEAVRESMGASGRRLIADHYSEPAFRQHMSALIGQARERRG